jgi:hypothetical protein
MRFFIPMIVLSVGLSLIACGPAETGPPPRVGTGVITKEQSTFYPATPGLSWTYLPAAADGSIDPNAAPFELRVEGQRAFKGKILTGMRFFGRAGDRVYYREFTNGGVLLYGWDSPDFVTVTYDPPILEYPPEGQLVKGFTWGNESKVTTTLQKGQETVLKISERYRVLGTEKYKVGDVTYDTVVINYEGNLSSGERLSSVIYFAPKIGEVRTKEGLILFRRNF